MLKVISLFIVILFSACGDNETIIETDYSYIVSFLIKNETENNISIEYKDVYYNENKSKTSAERTVLEAQSQTQTGHILYYSNSNNQFISFEQNITFMSGESIKYIGWTLDDYYENNTIKDSLGWIDKDTQENYYLYYKDVNNKVGKSRGLQYQITIFNENNITFDLISKRE